MIRLCFALGSWQIIMLAAALRQADENSLIQAQIKNYLVLYGDRVTDELKKTMQEVANITGEWEKIIDACDLLNSSNLIQSQQGFKLKVKNIIEQIGIKQAEELWLCKLTNYPEKLIIEAYANSKIFLYEDGLHTYVTQQLVREWSIKEAIKKPITGLTKIKDHWVNQKIPWRRVYGNLRPYDRVRLCSHHLHRLSGMYLYIAKDVPIQGAFSQVPQFLIEDEIIRNTINASSALKTDEISEVIIPPSKHKYVLVLGQCFARFELMSFAEELHIYRQVINTLVEKGYSVLWKDHPRVTQSFFPQLAEDVASDRINELQLSFTLPVELIVPKLGIVACISGFSSSLFYLPRLQDIPTYTFAQYLSPYLKGDFSFMIEITLKTIPLISEIT